MNDRDRQLQRPRDDRDGIVDDFFAAHRGQVMDQGADEETWAVITRRAGRERRPRGVWVLAGAVAASAAAVAVLVGQSVSGPVASPAGASRSDEPQETATQAAVSAVPPSADTPADASTDTWVDAPTGTSADAPAGTVTLPPADLSAGVWLVDEPTGDEGDLRSTVYNVRCEAEEVEWECPGLAVSEDGGQTWRARVDMYAAGYYAAVSSRERTWMWAAGGERPGIPPVQSGLVRSDDAGRSWREVPTRGEGVLGVQAFRSTLVVVTQGCGSGTADSCLEVVVTDVSADDARTGRRVVTVEGLPQHVVGVPVVIEPADLQATYAAVYLHLPHRGVSYRIADGDEVATTVDKPGCEVSAAPESADGLLAVCDGRLEVSDDGGRTWRDVPGPAQDVVAAASNDGQRLAAATEDGLWVRAGDGQEWERALPWTPGRTRLAALGGRSMSFGGPYRYYEPGEPRLSQRWVSEDDGQTWTEEPRIEVASHG